MPPAVGLAIAVSLAAATSIQLAIIVLALGLLQIALAPKGPKLRPPEIDPTKLTTGRQPISSRPIIYGKTRVGGNIIYITTQDSPPLSTNMEDGLLHLVIVFAGHEVEEIGTILFNDTPIYSSQIADSGLVTKGPFTNWVLIKKHLGSDAQAAEPLLVADIPEWTAAHTLSGIAYVYVRLTFDRDIFPTGLPNITAVIKGKKVFDPRDTATRWSPNAALCIRDYLTDSVYGFGASAADINDTATIVAANISDEFVITTQQDMLVTGVGVATGFMDYSSFVTIALGAASGTYFSVGDKIQISSSGTVPAGLAPATDYFAVPLKDVNVKDGAFRIGFATTYANALKDVLTAGQRVDITDVGSGTITLSKIGEPRYTSNGVVDTTGAIGGNLQDLISALGGRTVFTAGQWHILAAAPLPTSVTFNEDDIISPIRVRTKLSARDRFNLIQGLYQSPVNSWQPTDFPSVSSALFKTEDNEVEIIRNIELPFTNRSAAAQRIGKIELLRARQEIVVGVSLNLSGMQVQAGDVIAIDNDRFGWHAPALQFQGTSGTDRVDFGDELDLTASFTLEAWVRPSHLGGSSDGRRILDKGSGVTGWGLSLGDSASGVIRFFHWSMTTLNTDADIALSINTWHHVAVVFSAAVDTVTIYIDGQPHGQTTGQTAALSSNADSLLIGNSTDLLRAFEGIIDDVRMWNVVRTQQDILDSKDIELLGSESGLVGYWKLNRSTDGLAKDSTTGARDGAIIGATDIIGKLGGKDFEIQSWKLFVGDTEDAPVLGVDIVAREYAASIFDWDETLDEVTVDLAPNTALPDLFDVSPPTDLVLTSGGNVLFLKDDGTVVSRIRAAWVDSVAQGVDKIEVQFIKTLEVEVIDSSPNANNGLNVGPTFFTGLLGEAPKFDGVDDSIDIVDSGDLYGFAGVAPFTLEVLVKPASHGGNRTILSKAFVDGSGQQGWSLNILPTGEARFIRSLDGADVNVDSVNILEIGEWTHVAITYDGTTINIFVDAFLERSVSDVRSLVVSGVSAFIGNESSAGGTSWEGDIDDVRVWDVTRSPQDIIDTHLIALEGNESGLVGYWKFETLTGWKDGGFVAPTVQEQFIWDVEDGTLYDVRIRVLNTLGVASDWVHASAHQVAGKTDSPINIGLVTVTAESFQIAIKWTDIPDPDRDVFEVWRGGSFGVGVRIARTNSLSAEDIPLVVGTYDYWVKAFDTSGNASTDATQGQITIAAPGTPQNAQFAIDKDEITLSWDESVADFAISHYDIRRGQATDFDLTTKIGISDTRKFNIPATVTSNDNWRIAAVDIAGNLGGDASVIVSFTNPSVSNLTIQVIDNQALLRWIGTPGSLPIERYDVRKGVTFPASISTGEVDSTFAIIQELASGTFTYWIVPIDTATNRGSEISVTSAVDDPPDFIFRNQFDTDWIGNVRTNLKAETNQLFFDVNRTSLFFDAVDDVVIVDDHATLNFGTGDFTIELWVKTVQIGVSRGIIAHKLNTTPSSSGYALFLTSTGGIRTRISDGVDILDADTDATQILSLNIWHHVALVKTGTAVEIFIDGVSRATDSNVLVGDTDVARNLEIGTFANAFWGGLIDDIRIWDDARTVTEINDNKDFELIGDETNLVMYLRINEGQFDTVEDLSSNSNDGNIGGAFWVHPEPNALVPMNTTETWADHFTTNVWADSAAKAASSFPIHVEPTPSSATFIAYYDANIVIGSSRIIVDVTSNILDGVPTFVVETAVRKLQTDTWTVIGAESSFGVGFQFIRITLTVTATAGDDLLDLIDMITTINSKLKNDAGLVSVTANPTAVTFNVDFLDISAVVATPNVVGGSSLKTVIDFNDIPNPTGFDVYVFNDTGGFPGTTEVRWEARGF